MEEEILVSKFISSLLCCWLLFGKCLLLPLQYYFRHRLSKWFLFCRLVLENKIITKLSESLSKLHSLTTILRWETELDVQGGQATTGCFTWELYLVISNLSLFPGSSSFQSLPQTRWWVTRMPGSPTKQSPQPSPPGLWREGAFYSEKSSHLPDRECLWLRYHWLAGTLESTGWFSNGLFYSLARKFMTALEIICKFVREEWSNKLYILYYGTLDSYYKEYAKSS